MSKIDSWRKIIFSQKKFLNPYEHPVREFPFYVDIEPTNKCNFDCLMCNRQIMTREHGLMSMEHLKRIVDEMSEYRDIGVGIRYFRHGEPTLHRNLWEMIGYAGSKGVLTYVSTNGMTINKAYDALFDSGLDHLRISMQGADNASFTEMRDPKNRGLYLPVIRNIIDLVHEREKRQLTKPFISISTTVTTEPQEMVDAYKIFWGDIVDDVVVGMTTFTRLEEQMEEIRRLIANKQFNEERIRFYAPCLEVLTKLSVNWNGDITACCSDVNGDLVNIMENGQRANISNTSLKDAWDSAHQAMLRAKLGPALEHADLYPCNVCYRENISTKFDDLKDRAKKKSL